MAAGIALPAPGARPTLRIIAIISPVQPRELCEIPWTGATIAEILAALGLPLAMRARIVVGDRAIERERWHAFVPPPGAVLVIRLDISDPITGSLLPTLVVAAWSSLGPTAAAAAGITAAAGFSGAAVAAAGAAFGAVIAGSVGMLGTLALSALFPPPSPPNPQVSTKPASFTITGTQNVAAPYSKYPRVFGKLRVTPIVVGRGISITRDKHDQYFTVLLSCGYGPLNIPFEGIRIGDTPLSDFQDVELQVRYGYADATIGYDWKSAKPGQPVPAPTPSTTPITLYHDHPTSLDLNVLLIDTANKNTVPTGWQRRTTAPGTDEIVVNFSCPQGVITINNVGNRRHMYIYVEVRYAPIGTNHGAGGDDNWTYRHSVALKTPLVIKGATMSEVRQSDPQGNDKWTVANGQYDVECRVHHIKWDPNSDINDTFIGVTYWTQLISIHHSDPFPGPQGCAMSKIALRIRASNQLSNEINAINCIASSILLDWDAATQTWIERETANPASIYRHILQGPENGLPVADGDIMLDELAAWHEYCENEGFYFHGAFDDTQSNAARRALVASIGRATRGYRGTKHTVIRDEPQPVPVRTFTQRNSWGLEYEKPFPKLPHALRVRFMNREADYQQDEIVVYDDGYSDGSVPGTEAAALFETLDLSIGVDNALHAWRMGRYHLAQGRMRMRTVRMSADAESYVVDRGDLIEVSHDVLRLGLGVGRVLEAILDGAGNCIAIFADEAFIGDGASSYAVRINKNDGTMMLLAVATFSGASQRLELVTPILSGHPMPEPDDLVTFGLAGQTGGLFVVKSIEAVTEDGPSHSATLSLIDYAPAVYDADANPPASFPSNLTGASEPLPQPIVSEVRSDQYATTRAADGTISLRIAIGADLKNAQPSYKLRVRHRVSIVHGNTALGEWAAGFYSKGSIVTHLGQSWLALEDNTAIEPGSDGSVWIIAETDDPWVLSPQLDLAPNIFISDVEMGVTYDLSIRYEDAAGRVSRWTEIGWHTVQGQIVAPPDIANFVASAIPQTSGFVARWDASSMPNVREYELRFLPGLDNPGSWAGATFISRDRSTRREINNFVPGAYTLLVAAIDTSGNYSLTPARANVTVVAAAATTLSFPGAVVNPGGWFDVQNQISAPLALSELVLSDLDLAGAFKVECDWYSNGVLDFFFDSGTAGGSGENGYLLRCDHRNGVRKGQILRVDNGAFTDISQYMVGANAGALAAKWRHVGISINYDGTLRITIDGRVIATAVDTTYGANGPIGFGYEVAQTRVRSPRLITDVENSTLPDPTPVGAGWKINNKGDLQLDWQFASPRPKDFSHFEIRVGGSSWATAAFVDVTKRTQFTVKDPAPGNYTYRIAAINSANVPDANPLAVAVTVSGPPTVTGLTATRTKKKDLLLQWDNVAGGMKHFKHYEIRTGGTSWSDAAPLTHTKQHKFMIHDLAPAAPVTYRVAVEDMAGNYGADASVSGSMDRGFSLAVIDDDLEYKKVRAAFVGQGNISLSVSDMQGAVLSSDQSFSANADLTVMSVSLDLPDDGNYYVVLVYFQIVYHTTNSSSGALFTTWITDGTNKKCGQSFASGGAGAQVTNGVGVFGPMQASGQTITFELHIACNQAGNVYASQQVIGGSNAPTLLTGMNAFWLPCLETFQSGSSAASQNRAV